MVTITSNINQVVNFHINQLQDLTGPVKDQLLRTVAVAVLPALRKRVHVDGKAADGSQIGTYNNRYLRLRVRKFNRTSDPKKIFSLTRQMENDMAVIASGNGYGIGYNNPGNYDKSQWVEEQSGKIVWKLAVDEKQLALDVANDFVHQHFNKK